MKSIHYSLKGLSYCEPLELVSFWRTSYSAENTAAVSPETLLAGGKDEEKTGNGT